MDCQSTTLFKGWGHEGSTIEENGNIRHSSSTLLRSANVEMVGTKSCYKLYKVMFEIM